MKQRKTIEVVATIIIRDGKLFATQRGVWQMEGLVGTVRRENRTGNRPISVEVGLHVIFRKKFTGLGDFVVSLP